MSDWNSGRPPKRGPYWTRSDPRTAKSTNAGWRWWFGDRWSNNCGNNHKAARELGTCITRNRETPLLHALLWRTKKGSK